MIISGIGARGPAPTLIGQHEKEFGTVFADSVTHQCAEAAIINALHVVCGLKVAQYAVMKLKYKVRETHVLNLAAVSKLMHKFEGSIVPAELRRCSKKMTWKMNKEDRSKVLAQDQVGIWLVHLKSPQSIHMVVVDADRRLIFDNEEKYPVKLTAENLKACGGPDVKKNRLVECRPMVTN